MKTYLINLYRVLSLALFITLSLTAMQTNGFAMSPKEEAVDSTQVDQYAAVSKSFPADSKNEPQSAVSTSAELDEINSILQATSRKIALLDAETNMDHNDTITDSKSPKSSTAAIKTMVQSDYEEDIRLQTTEGIVEKQSITQEFNKAKRVKINPGTPDIFGYEAPIAYQTQAEIIKSVVSDEVLRKKIDLDFDETALGDIVQTISKIAEVNIVLDPSLKSNKFDLHLTAVSIQEALLLIADSFKLGFKRVGDSLYVTLRDELLLGSQTSRVFKLKNINVNQAKEFLGDMGKKIQSSPDLNSLIAVGQPEEIEKIEKAINRIDQPQPQVILQAKIIEISRDGLKELGVDWSDQMTMNFQESSRPVTFSDMESGNNKVLNIYSLARNPVQFSAAISMLENQNKAKVLSSPSITTLNGKESNIFVGDRIPYTITNVSGGVATTEVRWVEPGIRLTITPSIIGDDFVVIKVEPEVSYIFGFRGPNNEYPQIKTREATANVRIKNNEPFILGGLLGQEDKKNLYKVPLLGSIPWIGNLFSHEKTTSTDVELIISITPTIVYGNLK